MKLDSKIYITLFALASLPIITNWLSFTVISNINLFMICIASGVCMHITEWLYKEMTI